MTEVISVRFRGHGKAYYFAPNGITAKIGDKLVVETSKGMELGDCAEGNHEVEDEQTVQPLRPVIRLATTDDLRVAEINKKREAEAMEICRQKIADHGLEMKLVDVECSFAGNKIIFFFTADGRVDFRELVKDLASVFRTRIELRQIGVRDEAKMLGGLGICGRPFCCHDFLDDFQPVSTKMAKVQSMSLNPVKISGTCGRLMCCLRYEQEAYEDLVKHVPKMGAFVETPDGYGTVTMVNLLRQCVKVKIDGKPEDTLFTYEAEDVAEIPGGRPPEGEPLPHVLVYRPKSPKQPQPKENEWDLPDLIPAEISQESEEKTAGETKQDRKKSSHSHRGRGKRPAGEGKKQESAEIPGAKPEPLTAETGENHQKKSGNNHRRHYRGHRGSGGKAKKTE